MAANERPSLKDLFDDIEGLKGLWASTEKYEWDLVSAAKREDKNVLQAYYELVKIPKDCQDWVNGRLDAIVYYDSQAQGRQELEARVAQLEYGQKQAQYRAQYKAQISNTSDYYHSSFFEVSDWRRTLETRYSVSQEESKIGWTMKNAFDKLDKECDSKSEKTKDESQIEKNIVEMVNRILKTVAGAIEEKHCHGHGHNQDVSTVLKDIEMMQIDNKRNFYVSNDIIPHCAFVDKRMLENDARPTPINSRMIAQCKAKEANKNGKVIWDKYEMGQVYAHLKSQLNDTQFDKSFGVLFCGFGLQFYSVEKADANVVYESDFFDWNDWHWVYLLYSLLIDKNDFRVQIGNLIDGTGLSVGSVIAQGGSSMTFAFWDKEKKENENENSNDGKHRNEIKRCLKMYHNFSCIDNASFEKSKLNEVEMYLTLESKKFAFMMPMHGVVTTQGIVYRDQFNLLNGITGDDILGIILPVGKRIGWDNRQKAHSGNVVRAVDELNGLGYVHLDLRWANILETRKGKKDYQVVFIDFQTCQPISRNNCLVDVNSLANLFGVKNDYNTPSIDPNVANPAITIKGALNHVHAKIKKLIGSS